MTNIISTAVGLLNNLPYKKKSFSLHIYFKRRLKTLTFAHVVTNCSAKTRCLAK